MLRTSLEVPAITAFSRAVSTEAASQMGTAATVPVPPSGPVTVLIGHPPS